MQRIHESPNTSPKPGSPHSDRESYDNWMNQVIKGQISLGDDIPDVVNKGTLFFSNPDYESLFREELFSSQVVTFRVLVIFVLILMCFSIGHDMFMYKDLDVFLVMVILRSCAIGICVISLILSYCQTFFQQWVQFISVLTFLLLGLIIDVSTVLPNAEIDNRTSSSTIMAFVVGAHITCNILFPYLLISSWIVAITFAITAYIFQSDSETGLTPAIQFGLLFCVNIFLLIGSFQTEKYKRRTFIQRQFNETKNRILQSDNMTMRQEMFRMVMEEFDCIDKTKALDTRSPIERSLDLLKDITTDSTLPERHFLKLKDVITSLGEGSTQLFKPDIQKQIRAGKGNLDDTTSRWLISMMEENPHGYAQMNDGYTSGDQSIKNNSNGGNHAPLSPAEFAMGLPHMVLEEEKQFQKAVETLDDWDYDIFEVQRLTNGEPLQFVSLALFKRHRLNSIFRIDQSKLRNFFRSIENLYKPNPYHNRIHAADVLQTLHFFCVKGELKHFLSELEIMGALIAAAVHDVDHTGTSNNFTIATRHPLAIIYNDKSVLENHHVSMATTELLKPENYFVESLTHDQYVDLRKLMIEMVLATDMFLHFDLLTHFKSLMNSNFDTKNKSQRTLVMQICIKCADVSHSAKSEALHVKWTDRIMEEFYRQGDEEKKNHLAISPFCDRSKPNVPKAQVGFMDFLLVPMFDAFISFLGMPPNVVPSLNILLKNRDHWKAELAKLVDN